VSNGTAADRFRRKVVPLEQVAEAAPKVSGPRRESTLGPFFQKIVCGPAHALVGRVDPIVVIGLALVAGGALPFATGEVLVAALAIGAIVLARDRRAWPLVAVGALAIAVGAARAGAAVRAHEAVARAADGVIVRTARCAGVARVESSPERVHGAMRWSGTLRDARCEGEAWSGRVTLFGGPEGIARGDEVEVVAQIAPPNRLWNESDPRPREARQASVRSGGLVDARFVTRGAGVLAWIDRERARARRRIDATFPDDVSAMARALVLGESDLAPEDDLAMRASGLSHLLAVSGMHLVIAVLTVVAGLRALLARVPRLVARWDVGRIAAAIGLPLAWAYAEFAGDGGSTRRAAWMLTTAFVARVLGRRADGARSFGWSIVAMAAGDALVAFDVSFALSAAATAGLLLFSRPIAAAGERLPGLLRPLVATASATIAATIPCAPILARFAPTLPLGGVVANLLAVPVGESIALPLCLVHTLLAPWPAAERGCACVASGALRVVRLIARGFAGIHALAIPVPPPTSWQLVALSVGLAGGVVARRAWRWPIVLVAAAVVLLGEVSVRRAGRPRGELRVTFLDVGQGDAALLDLPDGTAMLIDGGGLVGSPVDTGQRVIAPILRAHRRDALVLAVLTHPHPDHFTGLASGLTGIRVRALWDSGQGERESVGGGYASLLASMRARDVPVLRPSDICGAHDLGGVRVDVLAPCPDSLFDRDPNDNSIVLRVSYGARAFLFVGDAEHAEEADLVRLDAARLRADVLKVGHHGSRTSSSPAFLAAVAPREAVISCGARNRFGHPAPTTLDALAAADARIWRTDHDGAVTMTTDGRSLDITSAATPTR
jgi:competence protein ComEC